VTQLPRPCLTCGRPTRNGARCPGCTGVREAKRGTTSERGYGSEHKRLRAQWAPRVERGEVACARCHLLIVPGEAWDLGHLDHDRTRYAGPEHASSCNRATAGRQAGQGYPPPKPPSNQYSFLSATRHRASARNSPQLGRR
jgi:hypothetical protein